ncbi:ECF transporter S component [Lactococcus fujiensis]|uniref:Thiamine transporter HmpT n=1 Tax=Lactococcus fujiensis JCM 16395 TaxID=1291764 RepID=A0A2A5RM50_9LACT|nr:ECF transporter S component [Lactococcus fujiensis]PCS00384.1 hypothetical protein RT41_GL001271 [Lactococcus fujiensis JCM 16395]
MNQKYSTKGIALLGLLSAATFVVGRFLQIPIPAINGYVTLLDAGIFTVALAFGKREGAIVGGLAAFLSDLTSGFPQWMFFSLIIHGGQGYLGALTKRKWINFILSGLFMVGGYFFATWLLYGFVAAVNPLTNIPNIIQTTIGYLFGTIFAKLLERTGMIHGFEKN